MRVEWLRKALANLDAEAAYLAERDPLAASAFVQAVMTDIQRLAQFPSLGREGRILGTREWPMLDYPYLIPYRVRDDRLQILRIFHTRRLPPQHW